jgi:hypothetical protein
LRKVLSISGKAQPRFAETEPHRLGFLQHISRASHAKWRGRGTSHPPASGRLSIIQETPELARA